MKLFFEIHADPFCITGWSLWVARIPTLDWPRQKVVERLYGPTHLDADTLRLHEREMAVRLRQRLAKWSRHD